MTVKNSIIGLFLLAPVLARSEVRVRNYNSETISFGPDGKHYFLKIRFHENVVNAFQPILTEAVAIGFIREGSICLDREKNCRSQSKAMLNCMLAVKRDEIYDRSPLLVAGKEYGPFENVFNATRSAVEGVRFEVEGIHSHIWKFKDPQTQIYIEFSCEAGKNQPESALKRSALEKLLDQKVSIEYFSKRELATPVAAPPPAPTSNTNETNSVRSRRRRR